MGPIATSAPTTCLVWNAIREAHEDGFRVFDFGRTDSANNSLLDFKLRWGTTVSDLPVYYYPRSYSGMSEARNTRLRLASQVVFQRMPDWCNRCWVRASTITWREDREPSIGP